MRVAFDEVVHRHDDKVHRQRVNRALLDDGVAVADQRGQHPGLFHHGFHVVALVGLGEQREQAFHAPSRVFGNGLRFRKAVDGAFYHVFQCAVPFVLLHGQQLVEPVPGPQRPADVVEQLQANRGRSEGSEPVEGRLDDAVVLPVAQGLHERGEGQGVGVVGEVPEQQFLHVFAFHLSKTRNRADLHPGIFVFQGLHEGVHRPGVPQPAEGFGRFAPDIGRGAFEFPDERVDRRLRTGLAQRARRLPPHLGTGVGQGLDEVIDGHGVPRPAQPIGRPRPPVLGRGHVEHDVVEGVAQQVAAEHVRQELLGRNGAGVPHRAEQEQRHEPHDPAQEEQEVDVLDEEPAHGEADPRQRSHQDAAQERSRGVEQVDRRRPRSHVRDPLVLVLLRKQRVLQGRDAQVDAAHDQAGEQHGHGDHGVVAGLAQAPEEGVQRPGDDQDLEDRLAAEAVDDHAPDAVPRDGGQRAQGAQQGDGGVAEPQPVEHEHAEERPGESQGEHPGRIEHDQLAEVPVAKGLQEVAQGIAGLGLVGTGRIGRALEKQGPGGAAEGAHGEDHHEGHELFVVGKPVHEPARHNAHHGAHETVDDGLPARKAGAYVLRHRARDPARVERRVDVSRGQPGHQEDEQHPLVQRFHEEEGDRDHESPEQRFQHAVPDDPPFLVLDGLAEEGRDDLHRSEDRGDRGVEGDVRRVRSERQHETREDGRIRADHLSPGAPETSHYDKGSKRSVDFAP